MKTIKRLSFVLILLGVWEALAPFILGYSNTEIPTWNAVAAGIALVLLGSGAVIASSLEASRWFNWASTFLGLWLVLAPFLLGYIDLAAASWNDILVGIFTAAAAAWSALTVSVIRTLRREEIDLE